MTYTEQMFQGDYRLAPQSGRLSLSDRLPGLRFFGALRKNLVSALEERRTVTKKIDRGARLVLMSRTPEEWRVINAKLREREFESSSVNESRFVTLLASFAPRRVILVIGPCASQWTSCFAGRTQLSAFLSRCKGLSHVTVADFFGSPEFSDAAFMDPTHLNIHGAQKLSKMISIDR